MKISKDGGGNERIAPFGKLIANANQNINKWSNAYLVALMDVFELSLDVLREEQAVLLDTARTVRPFLSI